MSLEALKLTENRQLNHDVSQCDNLTSELSFWLPVGRIMPILPCPPPPYQLRILWYFNSGVLPLNWGTPKFKIRFLSDKLISRDKKKIEVSSMWKERLQ